jgi:mannose-6-phosphate isomerase
MGTHPNLPSELDDEASTLLKDYIKQHPDVLGEHEGGDLKFLFKVLSVEKALSVQSHPNKVILLMQSY